MVRCRSACALRGADWFGAQVTEGSIEFAVNKVDGETGEFSGVFVSEQVRDAIKYYI